MTNKIRLLICTPKLKGGLSAVVNGIEIGLAKFHETVSYKRIPYARSFYFNNYIVRAFVEIKQFIYFIFFIINYKPEYVLIETSFDQKTIFRDFLHVIVLKFFGINRIIHVHGGHWHLIHTWKMVFRKTAKSLLRKVSLVIVTSNEELKFFE